MDNVKLFSTLYSDSYSWHLGTGSEIVSQSTSNIEPYMDVSIDINTKLNSTTNKDIDSQVSKLVYTTTSFSIYHATNTVLEAVFIALVKR